MLFIGAGDPFSVLFCPWALTESGTLVQLARSEMEMLTEAKLNHASERRRKDELQVRADCLRGLSTFHKLKESFTDRWPIPSTAKNQAFITTDHANHPQEFPRRYTNWTVGCMCVPIFVA